MILDDINDFHRNATKKCMIFFYRSKIPTLNKVLKAVNDV